MRRRKRKKQRKIIVLSLITLLFILSTGYAAFNTNLNITSKGNLKIEGKVLKSWGINANTDFHTDFYRENIINATFLNTNKVPSDAIESWDVSQTQDKGVMAYVLLNTNDQTKYDLYIGAKGGVVANEFSEHLFRNFYNIKTIDFNNNFDTSEVISMGGMFNQCWNLETLDLSTFNTRKVTTMQIMFMGCNSLTELDLSNFDTSNVTNMDAMFSMWNNETESESTGKLTKINLSGFKTNKVKEMKEMFNFNRNLTTIIGLEEFDTSNVTTMTGMFSNCEKLTTLNLCSFNTNKVTDMRTMFYNTTSLNQVKVGPNWTTANAMTNNMFNYSKISEVTTGKC